VFKLRQKNDSCLNMKKIQLHTDTCILAYIYTLVCTYVGMCRWGIGTYFVVGDSDSHFCVTLSSSVDACCRCYYKIALSVEKSFATFSLFSFLFFLSFQARRAHWEPLRSLWKWQPPRAAFTARKKRHKTKWGEKVCRSPEEFEFCADPLSFSGEREQQVLKCSNATTVNPTNSCSITLTNR
jgi:hypothetical protein